MDLRLVAAALINLCLGSLFAWSLFVEPLGREFGSSPAALAGVFSVAVAMFAAVALAGGTLIDRKPPRRIVIAAACSAAGGLVVASRADALAWVIVGYGVLFGIGNGLGYASAVAIAGKGFGDRRGLALGIVVGAYAAGPLVASPVIAALLAAVGWRATFVVLAMGIGVLLAVGAALVGGGASATAATVDATGDVASQPGVRARALLLRPRGLMLWLAFLFGTLPALLVIAHAATIAGSRGLRDAAVGAAVATLGAGNLAGRAGGGWLSDRIGRLPGLRAATSTLAAACLALATFGGTATVLVVMTVVGIAYGAQAALVPALTADLFGVEHFAANFGRVFTGWGVAGLLGPQAGAWLGGADRGFAAPLWLGAASAVAALVLHLVIGRLGDAAPDEAARRRQR